MSDENTRCTGLRPSRVQEVPVVHFHRTLAEYMGSGAPEVIASRRSAIDSRSAIQQE